jgi:hypothetical protein
VEVLEVTKDYAIVDDEKIYFDEPFDEVPDKADFEQWLHRIGGLLKTLLGSEGNRDAEIAL